MLQPFGWMPYCSAELRGTGNGLLGRLSHADIRLLFAMREKLPALRVLRSRFRADYDFGNRLWELLT